MRFQITPEGEITRFIPEAEEENAVAFDLKIPDVIDGVRVKAIGKFACSSCSFLRSIQFPLGLISIGDGAFFDCRQLEFVKFQSDLITLGDRAFLDCILLKNVEGLRATLTRIGKQAFHGCRNMKSIEVPKGVKIGDEAFVYCFALQNVFVANPSEVERVRGLLPEHLRGLVKVNPWSELRSAWIGAMVFGGLVDPRFATDSDSEEPLSAGAPAGGGGSGAALG